MWDDSAAKRMLTIEGVACKYPRLVSPGDEVLASEAVKGQCERHVDDHGVYIYPKVPLLVMLLQETCF